MENAVLQNIRERRSVRAFNHEQIPADALDAILSAGAWAASGMNLQGWKIISIQSPEVLKRFNEALRLTCLNMPVDSNSPKFMHDTKARAADPDVWLLFASPTYFIVTYDGAQGNAMADSALALGNMMLAARSLGIGTVWHNLPAKLPQNSELGAFLGEIGLPEGHRIFGTLAAGYPTGDFPAAPPRKEDVIVKL